jgi:hypothetical protein
VLWTVTEEGVTDWEKSGVAAGVTTSETVVERTSAPLEPVMLMAKVPVGVLAVVATVIVEEPEVVTEAGEKLAVAPEGSPLALKVTVPVKPPDGVTVAVYVVLAPRTTLCELGVAETEKSGVATALWLIQIGADHISAPSFCVT